MRALAAVVLLSACGPAGATSTCDGMVAGMLMGSFSVCNTLDQLYRQNLDTYTFTGDYTELPTNFTWATEWELKGEPKTTGAYTEMTRDIKCNITMKKGKPTWVARYGGGVPVSGTCQLLFTDVTADPQDGNTITYKVKGTVSGHLEAEPNSGSTGAVDVTMDFCNGDAKYCPPLMR
jgi:hypothetical protein